MSTTLADALLDQFALAEAGHADASPELQALRPLLVLQQRWSGLPAPQRLLAETLKSREGWHLFLYPFAGRHVHLGLASLLAWRVAQVAPRTFSMAVNDYGLELLCATEVDWPALLPQVLAPRTQEQLLHEVLASLNATELAQRRFREIARVAGLIYQGYPGERRSSRQLQASSSLFWEVFRQYDPGNQLLAQAQSELLAQELEIGRLAETLARMEGQQLAMHALARPTPLAFPLMVARFREQLSNERVADRIARMVAQLEQAAGGADEAPPPAEAASAQVRQTLAFDGPESSPSRRASPRRNARRPRG